MGILEEKPLLQRMREISEDHAKYEQGGGSPEILDEAIDEIERLRAALDWISDNGPDDAYELREKARAALAPNRSLTDSGKKSGQPGADTPGNP